MKFFYINNDICLNCSKCAESCPTQSIYLSEGKLYINYDKCISCGACYRDCHTQAISIEKLETITQQINRLEKLKEKLEKLENENTILRRQLSAVSENIKSVIDKLPDAAFVSNRYGVIITANRLFTELFYQQVGELSIDIPTLSGVQAMSVLPPAVYEIYRTGMLGESVTGKVMQMRDKRISLSVHTLSHGDMVLMIARNLNDTSVHNTEIAQRLTQTIDSQMKMVQNIGFLLGEGMSEIVRELNSIVKITEPAPNKESEDEK